MNKPVLVIMAAGMGSRYGGLKQIDPVDEQGNKIIDFSIYDAVRAGFEKVIFIIKKENEQDFRSCIGDNVKRHIQVEYVYQEMTNIPAGFSVPEGRVKPWGTAHAILSCKGAVDGPFAVINADDFYGREAFQVIYNYLSTNKDDEKHRYAMVGYALGNTLTENGSVSRGICTKNEEDCLTDIIERTKIVKTTGGAAYTEDGVHYIDISPDSIASMNMWGFTKSFLHEAELSFAQFFKREVPGNPLKAECYLPFVVDELLKAGKATVRVLESGDRWFGVTYKEDKPFVQASIAKLKESGAYPKVLWETSKKENNIF